MEERRKIPRKYLMFYARVFDRRTGELLGYLADLTSQGAMLISETPLESGLSFRLKMDLPDRFFERDHLNFEARSVWCSQDVDPKLYNTGFQMVHVDPQDIEVIDQINERFGLRE
jgi:hypothetical protein